MIHLKIGLLNLSIEGIEREQLPENSLLFLSENEHSDINYRIETEKPFPSIVHKVIYRKNDIIVFQKQNNLESRLIFSPDDRVPYAYYDEIDERNVVVYFNPYFISLFSCDTIFYSLLALERHLNKFNSFVYHCAYLDFDGKAYLFSGPSGMGKSTQSNLWCKVFPERAWVVNGDKCLLIKEEGKFYALGWPICGSSGICHNNKKEVAAIVLLQQAPENSEVPERHIKKFKKILEQLAVNYWNVSFVNNAMSFAEDLCVSVPCCTYACNMKDEAVTTLYNILHKNSKESD